jgi:peptidoglycan/LPS O-acetylase OafA/YrhL
MKIIFISNLKFLFSIKYTNQNKNLKSLIKIFQKPHDNVKKYFFCLDLSRGLAAIFVAIYHYKHFYITNKENYIYSQVNWPFYDIFWIPYHYGYWAVQYFWLISGFIFANVYTEKNNSKMFFANRLARLYPLHIITLLAVATLQGIRISWLGDFAIYQNNDLYHFILHLAFASNWGFENGFSFNAPIWSVSLEIIIYIIFWISLSFLYNRGILWPAALTLFFAILSTTSLPEKKLWTCGFYFFSGVCVYLFFHQLRINPKLLITITISILIFAAALILIATSLAMWLKIYILFIGILMFTAWADLHKIANYLSRISFIGKITYSIYLWHFPIQLVILLYLDGVMKTRTIIESDLFLLFYVLSVLIIAYISYQYIESPLRRSMRAWFSANSYATFFERKR